MPFFPYTDRNPSTGLYAGQTPLGEQLDRAANAVCGALGAITQWTDAAYRSVGVPRGAANLLSGAPIWNGLCAPHGGSTVPPAIPGIPNFPVNCDTFGIIRSYTDVSGTQNPPNWILGETIWICGGNVGRPIGRPRWKQFTPSTFGYVIDFERADGSGTIELSAGQTSFGDVRSRVQIAEIDINYCPSCSLPPPPPPPPEPPPPEVPPDPEEPPTIVIDIDFPGPPGLPPISFPVTYSPTLNLDQSLSLQPTLVLAPRLDLNPNFDFAPSFEFSTGGISITAGGYPEPRPTVTTIVDCDCPDPCPPGGEVDYERIATIVSDRLEAVRDIPGSELAVTLGPVVSGAEVSIGLPDGVRGILYEVDLTSYTGGASFASTTDLSVFYPGYAWFGYDESFPGGERIFINAVKGYFESPGFANRFSAVCQLGATIAVRWVATAGIPAP